MARTIDIDQKLAAKGELNREPVVVTFRGQQWTFASAMPIEIGELISDGKVVDALLLALDPQQHDAFRALGITIPEAGALVEGLAEIYGVAPGESPASE